jgi:hypothetical protein
MPPALLYYLLQTWATDPHHHPRPLAQARKKGTAWRRSLRRPCRRRPPQPLRAAKSVHIVGADLDGHFDFRTQGSSAIGTITLPGMQVRITVIGGDGYERDRPGP